jgi:hypothetical protein
MGNDKELSEKTLEIITSVASQERDSHNSCDNDLEQCKKSSVWHMVHAYFYSTRCKT